jgi:hypothetical protein
MPSARLLGVLVTLAFLVAFLGIPLALWWEGRRPSSYPVQQEALEAAGVVSLADWRALSTEEQEAADNASLDRAEQAELDAEDNAREAAEFLAQRAQANALFHP